MKILINAISAKAGGIVTYTNNLARSFLDRNVDATFALSDEFNLDVDIPVLRVSVGNMRPVRRALWEQTSWRRIVAKHNPDILFSSANFGLLAPPVPQVLLVREGGLFDSFYLANVGPSLKTRAIFHRIARRKLIIASAKASQNVLTPTEAMKDMLLSWSPDLNGRVDANLYGTITNFVDPGPHDREWKSGGVLKLLYVSAYYPHKQPGLVSEAVALLNAQGIPCHLTLTMDLEQIADTPGGDKDHFLLNKGLERGHVTMIGNIPYQDLPDIYQNHDLFVFPSLSETFGHPLVEAMGMGIPIVASDTSVHREVCNDSALYFSPLSPSDLARQIQDLNDNSTLRESITQGSQQRTATHFMWETHVDRLLDVFAKFSKNQ